MMSEMMAMTMATTATSCSSNNNNKTTATSTNNNRKYLPLWSVLVRVLYASATQYRQHNMAALTNQRKGNQANKQIRNITRIRTHKIRIETLFHFNCFECFLLAIQHCHWPHSMQVCVFNFIRFYRKLGTGSMRN